MEGHHGIPWDDHGMTIGDHGSSPHFDRPSWLTTRPKRNTAKVRQMAVAFSTWAEHVASPHVRNGVPLTWPCDDTSYAISPTRPGHTLITAWLGHQSLWAHRGLSQLWRNCRAFLVLSHCKWFQFPNYISIFNDHLITGLCSNQFIRWKMPGDHHAYE